MAQLPLMYQMSNKKFFLGVSVSIRLMVGPQLTIEVEVGFLYPSPNIRVFVVLMIFRCVYLWAAVKSESAWGEDAVATVLTATGADPSCHCVTTAPLQWCSGDTVTHGAIVAWWQCIATMPPLLLCHCATTATSGTCPSITWATLFLLQN